MKWNWRLTWFRATHHVFSGDDWTMVIGSDINNRDWGVTYNHGELRPIVNSEGQGWRRWRVEWRINIRWPISVRRRTQRGLPRTATVSK